MTGPSSTTAARGGAGLAERLAHDFADPGLLHQALSHRSWCGEQDGAPSNERLEFLGDAVLGLVVAEHSYRLYPDLPEGQLAKMRAAVVNARVLAEIADELGVGEVLLLGRGEEASGGRTKASILADALEAVIGAVYLDAGWEAARSLILQLVGERLVHAAAEPDDFDHKSRLQELAVRQGDGVPRYAIAGSGPDHDRHYVAEVLVGGVVRGTGEGSSKKDAEQEAARNAWQELRDA
ncbi:MAG TPA: ribonuclease III [Acidimicrobiales bacterium]